MPLWLMRQAGGYLPEYRALREQAAGFLDLCFDSKRAAEITLQPIRRFGFDVGAVPGQRVFLSGRTQNTVPSLLRGAQNLRVELGEIRAKRGSTSLKVFGNECTVHMPVRAA